MTLLGLPALRGTSDTAAAVPAADQERPAHLNTNIVGVQVLRGLAAAAVVVHHMLEVATSGTGRAFPNWITTSGAAGVDIFFVISGLIMVYSTFSARAVPLSFSSFLMRRFSRIYPFYWLCCLAMFAIAALGFLQHNRLAPWTIAQSLLLFPTTGTIISVSWTLSYEIVFYVIFACTLPWRSMRVSVIASIMVIGLALAGAPFLPSDSYRNFIANPLMLEFCFGMVIAVCLQRYRAPSIWWTVPAIVLLCTAPIFIAHDSTNGLPAGARVLSWGVSGAILVAISPRICLPGGLIGASILLLGDASYAIYLTHAFVMIAYGRLLKIPVVAALYQAPIVVLVVIVALAGGMLCHVLVEKRVVGMFRRADRTRS